MIDIEKLAIECGANTRLAETMFEFTQNQLNAFAKAYLNEWLKEQAVAGYYHKALGEFYSTKEAGEAMKENRLTDVNVLIALPCEMK